MEVLGGNGYVEDGPIARRFRESPLNSIWEGSGNIMCLDVLRALSRAPRTQEVLRELLGGARGADPRFDRFVAVLLEDLGELAELPDPADGELRARELTQRIALCTQAALLLAHGPAACCEAFLATRLAAGPPAAFGTLPRGTDFGALTARVLAGKIAG
jgi:putative acyl-CoA dehydrogenase